MYSPRDAQRSFKSSSVHAHNDIIHEEFLYKKRMKECGRTKQIKSSALKNKICKFSKCKEIGSIFGYICLLPPQQFFSYPVAIAISGDSAANLNLCLAIMAVSSEGSFTCLICCDFIRCHSKD
jgi:hypothetical protein